MDFASPFGTLVFVDLIRFLRETDGEGAAADIAPPFGVIDSLDKPDAARSIYVGSGG